MASFATTVDRYCVRAGTEPLLTDDGFLIDRWFGSEQLVEGLVPLTSAFARSGVLLGSPGAGKTRGLRALVDAAAGASDGAVVRVDMGAVHSESAFERKTRPLSERRADRLSPSLVLLDGLEECPPGPKVMCEWFADILSPRLSGDERLLISCRGAAYSELIRDTVDTLFGKPDRYTLAPLREADVAALARERSVVPETFLAEVRDVGVGALAATPLGLELLLTMYAVDGRLPKRRAELYAAALPRMSVAQGEGRDGTSRVDSRTQRMIVAGRICACLLLAGASAVVVDDAAEDAGDDACLPLDDLLGGPMEVDAGGAFRVDGALVRGTLGSALFAGRGSGIVAPAHSTYAAYLAATYLVARGCSVEQLRPLFVQRGEVGTPGIHPALRETAAWLIGLASEHGAWLAAADPEALLPYTDVVDSPALLSELTMAALSRAHDGRLERWPSYGAEWSLAHPALADTLRPILGRLQAPDIDTSSAMGDFGAGQLALVLARQVESADLAPELAAIALAEHLPVAARTAAARLVFQVAPDAVASSFRELLNHVVAGTTADPKDELRGCLLDLLWPDYLSVHELLQALAPPRSDNLGAYFGFRSEVARRFRDEDLDAVVDWAVAESLAGEGDTAVVQGIRSAEMRDREFSQRLVDRLLENPGAQGRLPKVAQWILYLLRDREVLLAVPAPLCIPEDEPGGDAARELRRALVTSLVGACQNPADAKRIAFGWSHEQRTRSPFRAEEGLPPGFNDRSGLVDENDLLWLLDTEAAGEDDFAARLHPLIRTAWNPFDVNSWDAAWALEGTRVWHAVFAGFFEPVAIDGDLAELMRQSHKRGQKNVWPHRDETVASLNQFLVEGANGDTANFWRLMHDLQFDPDVGSGPQRLDDDLRDWPGVKHLQDNWPELLDQASQAFLNRENPHIDEWLGTDRYDLRAWAGYLAIAYLNRRPHGLGSLPEVVWRTWAPAIAWFPVDSHGTTTDNKRQLLKAAAEHARADLEDVYLRLLRAAVSRAQLCPELRTGDAIWSPRLETDLLGFLPTLLRDTNATPSRGETPEQQAWLYNSTNILELLISEGTDATQGELLLQLDSSPTPINNPHLRATVALKSLYRAPAAAWPTVLRLISNSKRDFECITLAAAERYREPPLEGVLPEAALVELTGLLLSHYPPSSDPVWDSGVRFGTGHDQVRSWRDRLLNTLAGLGTQSAVQAMREFAESAPSEPTLRRLTAAAEGVHRVRQWTNPTVRELMQLLADKRNRMVRSATDLTALVVEALAGIQKDLTSGIAQSFLLWNEMPRTKASHGGPSQPLRWPKYENDLSDYLYHALRMRLQNAGVVVDREVQVDRNTSRSGNRVDLLVQATPRHPGQDLPASLPVSVVIEVKGNWHDDLHTAMEDQLVNDYLPHQGTHQGIYLVGDFPLDQWTHETESKRRKQAKRNKVEELDSLLATQAELLNETHGVEVTPIVLSLALVDSADRNKMSPTGTSHDQR